MIKKALLLVLTLFAIFIITGLKPASAASPDELLGFFETPLFDKSPNRVTNIKLAGEKIQQLVLQPGEIFSFNGTVGKRTKERGFKEASIFESGKVVQGLGGGICQLSSTLYQAALKANLKITEVHRHSQNVTYIAPGLDAAISWGVKDLKFQNNLDVPITFSIEITNAKVQVAIYKVVDKKPVNLYYNGNLLELQPPAYTFQGVTYVPLRPLTEQLGHMLSWDKEKERISIVASDTNIVLEPAGSIAWIDDELVPLTNPLQFQSGVTFLPLRFLADIFSLELSWVEEMNSVFINLNY